MRAEKQLLLDEIREKVASSKACLFTRYERLNPNTAFDLRLQLARVGGGFSAVRKRLLIKAAAGEGLHLDRALLKGHIGVIFSHEDFLQTAKLIFQFSKENEEVLEVLGGHFEGALYSGKEVKALSLLPPQPQMRAQFLGLLEAPMVHQLSLMEGILTSLLFCLQNKCEKENN